MELHNLQPIHKPKKIKRIGRGGKRGNYSGRGIKGQKSRAGAKLFPSLRETILRTPKKRGYKFKSIKEKPVVLNLKSLNKFEGEKIIDRKFFLEKKIIKPKQEVKILGEGEIKTPFVIKNLKVSKKAKEKIEKAGGKIIYE